MISYQTYKLINESMFNMGLSQKPALGLVGSKIQEMGLKAPVAPVEDDFPPDEGLEDEMGDEEMGEPGEPCPVCQGEEGNEDCEICMGTGFFPEEDPAMGDDEMPEMDPMAGGEEMGDMEMDPMAGGEEMGDMDPMAGGEDMEMDPMAGGEEMEMDPMAGGEEMGDMEMDPMAGDEEMGDELGDEEMVDDEELGDEDMVDDEDVDEKELMFLKGLKKGMKLGMKKHSKKFMYDDDDWDVDAMQNAVGSAYDDDEVCPECDGLEGQECEICGGRGYLEPGMMGDDDELANALAQNPHIRKPFDMTKDMSDYHDAAMRKHMSKCASGCRKGMKKEEACADDNFLNSLLDQTKSQRDQKHSSGLSEDALLAMQPEEPEEPKAGEAGFAPQGKIGGIGGGYTMDDFKDMPTLGQ